MVYIEKSIYQYFGRTSEADEIRDMIIYNPDFDLYYFKDLLEEQIEENPYF